MPGLPQQRQFNPYSENGGTILAIAGADFSVIAGDTRQSEGYSIQTRYAPKVFRLCVLFLFSVEERFSMLTCSHLWQN
jgi:20S proteasome subunit beta 6